jgi:hypothetical protein
MKNIITIFIIIFLVTSCQKQADFHVEISEPIDFLIQKAELINSNGEVLDICYYEAQMSYNDTLTAINLMDYNRSQKGLQMGLINKKNISLYQNLLDFDDINDCFAYKRIEEKTKNWAFSFHIPKNKQSIFGGEKTIRLFYTKNKYFNGNIDTRFYKSNIDTVFLNLNINVPPSCQKIFVKGSYAWSETNIIPDDIFAEDIMEVNSLHLLDNDQQAEYSYNLIQKNNSWGLLYKIGSGLPAGKIDITLGKRPGIEDTFSVDKPTRNGVINLFIPCKNFSPTSDSGKYTDWKWMSLINNQVRRTIIYLDIVLWSIRSIEKTSPLRKAYYKTLFDVFEANAALVATMPEGKVLPIQSVLAEIYNADVKNALLNNSDSLYINWSLIKETFEPCEDFYKVFRYDPTIVNYLYHMRQEKSLDSNKDYINAWYDFIEVMNPILSF